MSSEARLHHPLGSGFGASGSDQDVWQALGERLDPACWRPRLAGDVESATFEVSGGGAYVMVANPRDQVHYRLTPAEASMLPLLDGGRTIGQIVLERLGHEGELDVAALADLVALLERGGFLTAAYVDVDAALQRALTHRRSARGLGGFFAP